CPPGNFECENGICISTLKRCDRTVDCENGFDEMNCAYSHSCDGHICSSGECTYTCHMAYCISMSKVCDGIPDCPHQDDEMECETLV
ncbi:hypothetical protein CAPTEDRAFT_69159, partial [Capitella teleta]